MRIALLANLAQNAPEWPGMPPDVWAHLDSWHTIDTVIIALEQAGHQVVFLEGDETLYNNLQAVEPDICFNLCQGHFGRNRTAHVPAMLEMLGLPYTGSGPLSLSLVLDTALSWRTLTQQGLPVPPFQVFDSTAEALSPNLRFPLRVKMSRAAVTGSAQAGVTVYDEPHLWAEVGRLLQEAAQPVLVEQVMAGREIVVSVVGNLCPPAARQIPRDRNSPAVLAGLQFFPPLEVESTPGLDLTVPAALTETQQRELQWLVAAVFRVLDGNDLAQITVCLDAAGKFTVSAIDLLPSLARGQASLPLAAEAAGWSYETLISHLLLVAVKRHQLSRGGIPVAPPAAHPAMSLSETG